MVLGPCKALSLLTRDRAIGTLLPPPPNSSSITSISLSPSFNLSFLVTAYRYPDRVSVEGRHLQHRPIYVSISVLNSQLFLSTLKSLFYTKHLPYNSPNNKMKFTIATVAIAATAVNALAFAEADADAGMKLVRTKGGYLGWCGPRGAPCGKRDLEVRDAEPLSEPIRLVKTKGGFLGWCGPRGAPCGKRDLEARGAEAIPMAEASAIRIVKNHGGFLGWCGPRGAPCGKRDLEARGAEPLPEALASALSANHGGYLGWCGPRGAACGKRDLESEE